jgi:hypothetical protein
MSEIGGAGKVLLVSATAWPASAKLAIAFLRQGCHVEAVCASGHPLRYVSGIRQIYPYRVLSSLRSLETALHAAVPDLIVPCDDGVVRQLHHLHLTSPALREVIERSLGSAKSYEIVDSRAMFMRVAKNLGVRIADTVEINTVVEMEAWFTTHHECGVLKIDDTYAGKGVRIADSYSQAIGAFGNLRRAPGLLVAVARWYALRDVLGIWRWAHRTAKPLTLQRYVSGTPANAMIACKDGTLLAMVAVKVLSSEGETGPACVVQVIANNDMKMAAERLAGRLGLSGFHGLDFVLDAETGHASLIELNPRCTQLGHLAVGKEGSLVSSLCRMMLPMCEPQLQEHIQEQTIAFFPQVLFMSGKCWHIEDAHIDIPWSELELVRQLAARDWRNRRWIVRLANAVRSLAHNVVSVTDFVPAHQRKRMRGASCEQAETVSASTHPSVLAMMAKLREHLLVARK